MRVMCLNAGSTSVKYATYEYCESGLQLIERGRSPTNATDGFLERVLAEPIETVAHRIVHSGGRFRGPTQLTDERVRQLRSLVSLAPLHQPAALSLIDSITDLLPSAKQVAFFDTDFFVDLPEVGSTLPVSEAMRKAGVRRYGFHGLAYASVLAARPAMQRGKTVLAHLGGGVSVTAALNGRPLATTMGMTPAGGLIMATRSGDLDPGLWHYLESTIGLAPKEIDRQLAEESGLLGLSGVSGDIGELLRVRGTNPRAALAIKIYLNAIAERIAGYAVRLGGLDHLSFSGGVAEYVPQIRDEICVRLATVIPLDRCETPGVVTPCDEESAMAAGCEKLHLSCESSR